jgi:hexosaminidase
MRPSRLPLSACIEILFLAATLLTPMASGQSLSLIPTPLKVELHAGHCTLAKGLVITLGNPRDADDQFSAAQLSEEISTAFGFQPARTTQAKEKSILLGRLGNSAIQARLKKVGVTLPDSLGNEGYLLHVGPTGILVAANSGAGLFYGVQTLKQLIRSNRTGNDIPCLTITDRPALRYRGWMLDISRGPIPTMAFLKQLIATMAEYKQNSTTLYTEHVFRLKSHPDIAPADGITAEEIAELSAFAKKYHIELIGNAQSFGHMENILAAPFYKDMGENSWVVSPARQETYSFLKDMYAEILPAYDSKLFHINCDEVSGLGSGPGKRMVDSMGTALVYAYHINRIADIIRPYGKRILMWGDIAVGNPQIIDRLPKDLVVVSWGYHAADSFDDAILPFKKSGFEFMVAPGVSCWGQVWPHMSNAVTNISNYTRDGAKLGAMGMMNTIWMDDNENLSNYNWHGLLWGAECAWNPARPLTGDEARKDREARAGAFTAAFDALFFGTPGVTETLFQFDSLRALPIRNFVTDQGVWTSMLEQFPEEISDKARVDNETALNSAQKLLARLQGLKDRVPKHGEVLDAAVFAARRVLFTAEKNLTRIALAKTMQSLQPGDIARSRAHLQSLLADLHSLKAEYAKLWQHENRGWSLHRVLAKYDNLGAQILDLDKTVSIIPDNSVADGKRQISLSTPFADQQIYYTTDGSDPTLRSGRYDKPFWIDRSSLIRARVYANGQAYALAEKPVMIHKAVGKLGKMNSRFSAYSPAYAAGGEMALVDGLRGSENFSDGRWQGCQGQNLDVVIDLQKETEVRKVSIGFMQQSYSWILMPAKVQFWVSEDGKDYSLAKEVATNVDPREEGTVIRDVTAEFGDLSTRFVRVVAAYSGILPAWHHAAGGESFIFADEIVVE